MLVTFSSKTHGNITMFGDVAIQLIKLMGHSGVVPSAILANDVSAALHQLQKALKTQNNNAKINVSTHDEKDIVSLKHRAVPLIELLENAVQNHCDVLWK